MNKGKNRFLVSSLLIVIILLIGWAVQIEPIRSKRIIKATMNYPSGSLDKTLSGLLRDRRGPTNHPPVKIVWRVDDVDWLENSAVAWVVCTVFYNEVDPEAHPEGFTRSEWWARDPEEKADIEVCMFYVTWLYPFMRKLSVSALTWDTVAICPEIGPSVLLLEQENRDHEYLVERFGSETAEAFRHPEARKWFLNHQNYGNGP